MFDFYSARLPYSVTLYDPQTLTEKQTIDFPMFLGNINCATVYKNGVWFARRTSEAWELYRYELAFSSYRMKASFECEGETYLHGFNGKYFYVRNQEYGDESAYSLVYDLESESKVMESATESVVYVDKAGTIFYKPQNSSTLRIYGTGTEIEGTEILREDDGIVYTYMYPSKVVYQYERGVLRNTIPLSEATGGYTKDYYFVNYENKVYDNKTGNVAVDFSEAKLKVEDDSKEKSFSYVRIRALWGDFVAVGFSNSQFGWGDDYIAIYRLGKWDEPVAVTKASEINPSAIKSYRFGGNTYLAVYSETLCTNLQELLLIQP